jgi:hypothetical protein
MLKTTLPTEAEKLVGNHFHPLSTTKTQKLYLLRTTFVKAKSMISYVRLSEIKPYGWAPRLTGDRCGVDVQPGRGAPPRRPSIESATVGNAAWELAEAGAGTATE